MLKFVFISIVYCCSIILNTSMAASEDQQLPLLIVHLKVNGKRICDVDSDPECTMSGSLTISLKGNLEQENLKQILYGFTAVHLGVDDKKITNLSCELMQLDGQPSLMDTSELLTLRGDELNSIIKDHKFLVSIETTPNCLQIIQLKLLQRLIFLSGAQSSSEDAQSSSEGAQSSSEDAQPSSEGAQSSSEGASPRSEDESSI